jgi:programmed cell death 6-interacting protein
MDILDSEVEIDEAARKKFRITRPLSHEANTKLVQQSQRYQTLLDQAEPSDEHVRDKWDEHEVNIRVLMWDKVGLSLNYSCLESNPPLQESLEQSIPASTGSNAATSIETRTLSRELRVQLEKLDVMIRDREQTIMRAQTIARADDIHPRISKAAAGFERLTKVEPIMFEDVQDEELRKYDRFIEEIRESGKRQDVLMSMIRVGGLALIFLAGP